MLVDPSVGARRGTGRVGVVDLQVRGRYPWHLSCAPEPCRAFVGVDVSCVHDPIWFLTTRGAEFRRLSRSLRLED